MGGNKLLNVEHKKSYSLWQIELLIWVENIDQIACQCGITFISLPNTADGL